jgi:hypothetical protein
MHGHALLPALATSGLLLSATLVSAQPAGPASPPWPAISVDHKPPTQELRDHCRAFDRKGALHECHYRFLDLYEIYQGLSGTGSFGGVAISDPEVEYQLLFTTIGMTAENPAGLVGAVFSGATLGIIPYKDKWTVRAEVRVDWSGVPVDRFTLEIPYVNRIGFIAQEGKQFREGREDLARRFGEEVVAMIRERESLSAAVLHKVLGADDYASDLVLPDRAGRYVLDGGEIFRNPLLGMGARYQHEQYLLSYIDVFVYPLRAADWRDNCRHAFSEAAEVQRQLAERVAEGGAGGLKSADIAPFDANVPGVSCPGARFDSTWQDTTGATVRSSTHVVVVADKFVKIRVTADADQFDPDLDAAVAQLVSGMRVPAESAFMARFRQSSVASGEKVDDDPVLVPLPGTAGL